MVGVADSIKRKIYNCIIYNFLRQQLAILKNKYVTCTHIIRIHAHTGTKIHLDTHTYDHEESLNCRYREDQGEAELSYF